MCLSICCRAESRGNGTEALAASLAATEKLLGLSLLKLFALGFGIGPYNESQWGLMLFWTALTCMVLAGKKTKKNIEAFFKKSSKYRLLC